MPDLVRAVEGPVVLTEGQDELLVEVNVEVAGAVVCNCRDLLHAYTDISIHMYSMHACMHTYTYIHT